MADGGLSLVAVSIAVSIGTQLLVRALTPSTKVEGPRLQDLKGTESSYGAPIPKAFGVVRLPGICIWQLPIIEESTSSRAGGKGGGSTRVTNYQYYWTGAIQLAEGEAIKLLRVWADTKLIVDYNGQNDGLDTFYNSVPEEEQYAEILTTLREGTLAIKPGVNFRFYDGNYDQEPDPAIQADIDEKYGEGSTPAYRGRVYIVFDRFPLADYGNRVPQFSFEVMFDGDTETRFIEPTKEDSALREQIDLAAVNFYNNTYYTVDADQFISPLEGIRKYRTDSNEEIASNTDIASFVPMGTLGYPTDLNITGLYAPLDGQLYGMFPGFPSTMYLARLDPDSMTLLDYVASGQYTAWYSSGGHAVAQYWSTFGTRNFLATVGIGGYANIFSLSYESSPSLIYSERIGDIGADPAVGCGSVGYREPIIWAVGTNDYASNPTNTGTVDLWRIRVSTTLEGIPPSIIDKAYPTKLVTITLADIEAATGVTGFTGMNKAGAVVVDQVDDCPIVHLSALTSGVPSYYWAKINDETGEILWTLPSQALPSGSTIGLSVVSGMMVMPGPGGYQRIDTMSGEVTETIAPIEVVGPGSNNFGFYAYNYVADAAVMYGTGSTGPIFYSRADPSGVSVGHIVKTLSYRGQLLDADMDVSPLTDLVLGYIVNQNQTIREAIEPLSRSYFFDACESDDIIKFRKFTDVSALTISADQVARKEGQSITETREQEADLPEQVFLSYYDYLRDHQTGTQTDKRVASPHRAGYTTSQVTTVVPIVMLATTAKRIVRRTLYARWVEREAQSFSLPRPFLLRDPIDSVTLDLSDHDVVVRLQETTIGADLLMDVQSVAADPSAYGLDAEADGGIYIPPTLPMPATSSRIFMIDGPYLRDVDVGAETSARIYLASAPVGSSSTDGSHLFTRDGEDGQWQSIGFTGSAPEMGVLTQTLEAPESPDRTDEENTITLRMWSGVPENVTTAQMRMGANPVAIINRTTNEVEYAQYRDAVQNADGTWTLSYLRRGARGTDGMPMTFTSGDYLIFLSTSSLTIQPVAISALGGTKYYKAVPNGGLFDQQPTYLKTVEGRNLLPYAPVHLAAELDGSDIDLSWVRRTRFNGEWLDGEGDVPLNEESEEYEVDIYEDDTFTTVLRTLEATAPNVTYEDADITADFGSIPDQISAKVYQIGQTGRGFARAMTVPVAA